jgi:hypothetical protein
MALKSPKKQQIMTIVASFGIYIYINSIILYNIAFFKSFEKFKAIFL